MSKKDKIQLAVIWGLAFVLYLGLYIWFQIYTSTPAHAASLETNVGGFSVEVGVCPPGSYNIGTKDGVNPICKLEPTGCPFGDSVPLDKCAPPPDIICNHDWSFCEPRTNAPVEPTPQNNTNIAPTPQKPVSTPKPTNNVQPDASYAAPNANDLEPVDEPVATAPIANDDDNGTTPNAPLFGGISSNEPKQDNIIWFLITGAIYTAISAAAVFAPSSWFAAIGALIRNPFN